MDVTRIRCGLASAAVLAAFPSVAQEMATSFDATEVAPGLHVLVGADGLFRTDMARLGFDIAFKPRVRRQVAAEIRAQFEAFAATFSDLGAEVITGQHRDERVAERETDGDAHDVAHPAPPAGAVRQ